MLNVHDEKIMLIEYIAYACMYAGCDTKFWSSVSPVIHPYMYLSNADAMNN